MKLTSPADLITINQFCLQQEAQPVLTQIAVGENVILINPLYIAPGTTIGSDCQIGPNENIEENCQIENQTTIENSVLLRGASIPAGTRLLNYTFAQLFSGGYYAK